MSLFDGYQRAVFNSAKTLFGDTATWTPSDGSPATEGKVLFNNPTNPIQLGDSDKFQYRPYDYSFEYLKGAFVELKQNVDQGMTETVLIGEYLLSVREIQTKYDGKTFIAFCEIIEQ